MQEILNPIRQFWDQWGFLGEGLTLIALLFTAGAAWRSASAARRAADEARVATTAQIMNSLLDEYSSDQMLDAMTWLRHYEAIDDLGVEVKLAKLRLEGPGASKRLIASRRRVSHYFGKIYLLQKAGYIDDAFVRTVVGSGEVEFYLGVIEPLETVANADYDNSAFKYFAKLHGLERRMK